MNTVFRGACRGRPPHGHYRCHVSLRRRAPEGSYFRDGASGLFGAQVSGFELPFGFMIDRTLQPTAMEPSLHLIDAELQVAGSHLTSSYDQQGRPV
jgi:hypothetical protein